MAYRIKYNEDLADDFNLHYYLERDAENALEKWFNTGRRSLIVTGPSGCGKTIEVNRLLANHFCEVVVVDCVKETEDFFNLARAYFSGGEVDELKKMGIELEGNPENCVIVFDNYFGTALCFDYHILVEGIRDKEGGCRAIFVGTGINLDVAEEYGFQDTLRMRTMTFKELVRTANSCIEFRDFDRDKANEWLYSLYIRFGGYPEVVLEYISEFCMAHDLEDLIELTEGTLEKAQEKLAEICEGKLQLICSMYGYGGVNISRTQLNSVCDCVLLSEERNWDISRFLESSKFVGENLTDSVEAPEECNLQWSCGYALKSEELVDTAVNLPHGYKFAWFTDAGLQNYMADKLFRGNPNLFKLNDMTEGTFAVRELTNQTALGCGLTGGAEKWVAVNIPQRKVDYFGNGIYKPDTMRVILFGNKFTPLKVIESCWNSNELSWSHDDSLKKLLPED